MRKLVLFDIDGTLLLTAGAGRRAITAALAELVGHSPAFGGVRFDGKTDPQIVTELLSAAGHPSPSDPQHIDALCQRYVGLLAVELDRTAGSATLMPGIPQLLDELERNADVLLGLLTGNLAQGAALKLRAAGIDPVRFRVGAYGSDAAHRPHLPPIAARRAVSFFGHEPSGAEVVIIGDTPADIQCGVGIGARALGVATGAYSTDELMAAGAHAAFPDLSATDQVIAAILE